MKEIGSCAFADGVIESVVIPDAVTTIGEGIFYRCSGLANLTLGKSLKDIGYSAFSGCTGLTRIVSRMENPPSENLNWWEDVAEENVTLYVPMDTKEKYVENPGWNMFKNIVEMGTTDLQSPSMPEASPVLFDLQGRQATGSPRKGIYIKNGRKSLYR